MEESYIPRTVSRYKGNTNRSDRQIEKPMSLEDHIRSKVKRIILFADAQCGKTTELRHLADTLEKDIDKIVIKYTLSGYRGDRLLEEQLTMHKPVPEGSQLYFLFDALDEVKEAWKETVINEIIELSEKYKTAIIVLTCRANYESSVRLAGFDNLYLDKLDNRFVKRFIELHSCDPIDLYELMVKRRYGIILTSPFFLEEVVNYYNTFGTLPLDKTVIYERFIQNALTVDNEKKVYSNRLARSLEESTWESFLCKLAFCMMDGQSQKVSYKEVRLVFPSFFNGRDDISAFPLIHIDSEGCLSFIHNSFREFFAAKSLVGLEYDEIKRIVCYMNTDTLIPSWTQPLMFLMSLLSREKTKTFDQLLTWMLEKYLFDIIWFGGDFVDERTKDQIFGNLYKSWAKELFSSKPGRLMTFAQSRTNVERVILGLEEGDESLCQYLEYADLSFLTHNENKHLCEVLLKYARGHAQEHRGDPDFYFDCLDLDIDCLKTRFALDGIIDLLKEYGNKELCFTALHLISILGLYDDYSTFIVENHDILFESGLDLKDFLSVFKKEDLTSALSTALRSIDYRMRVYKALFEKVATYEKDEVEEFKLHIINEVMTLRHALTASYDMYFALREFCYTFSDRSKITEECLGKMRRILIERYQTGDKNHLRDEYNGYLNVLSLLITKNVCAEFTDEKNKNASYDAENLLICVHETGILEEYLLMDDQWPLHCDILQESIDALFDKETIFSQVRGILETFNKQGFSSGEDRAARNWMWDYHAHCRGARSAFHLLLENRYEWSLYPDKYIDMESVPEWIENEVKYTCFVINYLDEKRIRIKLGAIHLSDKQRDVLTALVKRVIDNPQKYDDRYTSSLLLKLLHIIFIFELKLEDEVYVSLIPYLAEQMDVYGSYIEEKRKVYLIDYVLDHLRDYESFGYCLEQFMDSDHSSKNNVAEVCYKRIIEHKARPLYRILHILLKNCNRWRGYDFYDWYKMLPTNSFSYNFFLKDLKDSKFLVLSKPVVKNQSGADLDAIHERLLSISKNSSNDEDILNANSLLVSFGDDDALQYMYDKCPDNDRFSSFPWPSFDYCDISNLALIKQFYIKAINKRYSEKMYSQDDEMDNIQKNLFRLSLDSEEALNSIMDFFDELALKYPDRCSSSLSHEVYLSFLENKSAKRTLSESAKRMGNALSE